MCATKEIDDGSGKHESLHMAAAMWMSMRNTLGTHTYCSCELFLEGELFLQERRKAVRVSDLASLGAGCW